MEVLVRVHMSFFALSSDVSVDYSVGVSFIQGIVESISLLDGSNSIGLH